MGLGHHCAPCRDKGQTRDAEAYCANCIKYYCRGCIILHDDLFPLHSVESGNHSSADRKEHAAFHREAESSSWHRTEPDVTCSRHPGERMDMYCPGHDELCCHICATMNHGFCHEVRNLKESKASSWHIAVDLQHLQSTLSNLQSQLERVIRDNETRRKDVREQKKDLVKAIRKYRAQINDMLDRLEKQTVEELDIMVSELEHSLQSDVDSCAAIRVELDRLLDELHTMKTRHESFSTYRMNECRDKIAEAEKLIDMMTSNTTQITFHPNYAIEEFLLGLRIIGKVESGRQEVRAVRGLSGLSLSSHSSPISSSMPPPLRHMYHVKFSETHKVQTKGDLELCYITGCCQLPDGRLVLVDCGNQRVKLLNQTFHVLSHCDTPDYAMDVCAIRTNEVVVTVNNKSQSQHEIHFIKVVNDELHFDKKINLTHDCAGIAHFADHLYIGSWNSLYLYTTSGRFLRKIYENKSNGETTVFRIAISDDGSKIYVTDMHSHRLVTLDENGFVLATLEDPSLQRPAGVCVASSGQVFVAGEVSNTIIQVDRDGRHKLATVASAIEGLNIPQALCFDRHASALIASQNKNDNILVYHME